MNETINNTQNYLVPSSGRTHSYALAGVFSATPQVVNFAIISKDAISEFSPQGVFIDNSLGTGALTITIQNSGYSFSVPSGAVQSLQFPAPEGQIHTITGNGQASIVYVDFPVLPYSSQFSANIAPGSVITSDTKIWDGAAWVNAYQGIDADAVAPSSIGQLATIAKENIFDGVNWQRVRQGSDADAVAPASVGQLAAISKGLVFDGVNWQRTRQGSDADAVAPSSVGQLAAIAKGLVFDGASWQRKRTVNIFKAGIITATGITTLWTPALGKKFRLMKLHIALPANSAAAAAGILTIQFYDNATLIPGIFAQYYIPLATSVMAHHILQLDLDNGILSALANNALGINLSFALTSGAVDINISGTEE